MRDTPSKYTQNITTTLPPNTSRHTQNITLIISSLPLNSPETDNFTCPKVQQDIAVSHPRYADPVDCQYFYVCINGETPRRNGCAFGQVFSTNTSTCTTPQEVPEW